MLSFLTTDILVLLFLTTDATRQRKAPISRGDMVNSWSIVVVTNARVVFRYPSNDSRQNGTARPEISFQLSRSSYHYSYSLVRSVIADHYYSGRGYVVFFRSVLVALVN